MKGFILLYVACLSVTLAGCVVPQHADGKLRAPRGAAWRAKAPAAPAQKPAAEAPGAAAAPQAAADPGFVQLAAADPRHITYSATYRMIVPDVDAALAQTRRTAAEAGGYLQEMSAGRISIRVPTVNFERATAALEALGDVTEQKITSADVTEQYVDLEVRIRSAKATLSRLLELLKQAQDVDEALVVEKQMTRVRAQLEQLEGQLNRLKNQVTFSTIHVTFTAASRAPRIPDELKIRLPFLWLRTLGADGLLACHVRG